MGLSYSFHVTIELDGKVYKGTAAPFKFDLPNGYPYLFRVVFDSRFYGDLSIGQGVWTCDKADADDAFVQAVGNYIELYYE